ncbi:MAG: electron transfer flavoprotein subunit alpha/FixB family protein [Lentisphaeria bacterium]|nr:electron transfer flavoprotein subunit alpha/FixB family protein [Lentisphaeria bacterium]
MSKIIIHQEKALKNDLTALAAVCPFNAIETGTAGLSINAGCKMCRLCTKRYPEIFEFQESQTPRIDKSQWQGIAVAAELTEKNELHPVSLELLGKARELAAKVNQKVLAFVAGSDIEDAADKLIAYGADEVVIYDSPELKYFRAEPFTAALEDFINLYHPAVVLVGGTSVGRQFAPRAAARFRTGLTADCTVLDIKPDTDLEQIRPAFGGNIMAHINTPNHRPQFATVRCKIFPFPEKVSTPSGSKIFRHLTPQQLSSKVTVNSVEPLPEEEGIEDAQVIVAAGKGIKRQEDLKMIYDLAQALNGKVAGTRCVIEAGWLDHKKQIGLSGRTVAPKLIICCGISGSVQFAAGMKGAEKIIAINNDPDAAIFKIAHIGIVGDIYEVIPALLKEIANKGAFL